MNNTITILDGGMGRELKRIGAPFSQPLWSAQALIESPIHVKQAHQNFIDAGAEIIIANSYACVPFHLGDALYLRDGAKLAQQAAKIAQTVAGESTRPVRVAGCIPPAFGSYRPDLFKPVEAKSIFNTLFQAQDDNVDLWIAETIASLEELTVIQSILSQSHKDRYYAFSLEDTQQNTAKLRSGESVIAAVEQVCQSLNGANFINATTNQNSKTGIFFNCSIPEVMEQAIKETKTVINRHIHNVDITGIEIGVYANNFKPINTNHKANDMIQGVRELTPNDYLEYAKRWHELGATTIGGCCGIFPEHIEALADWKKNVNIRI